MRHVALFASVALSVACGTNRPEIPKELLDAPAGCGPLDYPEGPYGTEQGAVVADMCFRGWARPDAVEHDADSLQSLSFGRFYDPAGDRYELLLVNSAALWCAACVSEHDTLPDHYRELAPDGFAILSALFENREGDPAAVSDLTLWVETFETPFPMALDPDYQLGAYAPAASAPLNLLVDARTMRILEKFTGDQASVLWPLVEGELESAKRSNVATGPVRASSFFAELVLGSTLVVASARATEPAKAGGAASAPEPPATRVEITDAVSVLYAGDNRDFRASSVPTVVNDDWGVFYNRLHAQLDHGDFRFGFRVDNAWFYASPDPTTAALELVERRPPGPANQPDPIYFRAKVNESGRELSNRYINWVYPAKYYATWSNRDLEVTVGDVYAELGHGLVLSMRKRDELASDDTIRGGKATGRLKVGDVTLGLTLLGGSANPLRIDEASGRYLGVHSSVTPGFLAVTEAGMPRAVETDFAEDTGECRTFLTCSYAPDRLAAGQFELEIGRTRFGTQGSLLARQDGLSPDLVRSARQIVSASQSVETSSKGGAFAVYFEAAGQKLSDLGTATSDAARAEPEVDAGHALYASATVVQLPWVFLLEAKHYRRFFPLYANVSTAQAREFTLLAWSAPPTGEAPYVDTEFEAFNTCVSGARVRTDSELGSGVSAFGWLGYWQTFAERGGNDGCATGDEYQNDVFDLASGLELTSRDRSSRAAGTVGSRFDDTKTEIVTPEGSTRSFYRELYLRYTIVQSLGGPFALELDGVHRRRRRALGGPGVPWFEGEHVTAVDWGSKWSFGMGIEYDTDPRVPPTYFNLMGRFRPTSDASVSLFLGQRRGTLRCEGGVCREVPPFEGVRLDGSVRF